MNFFQDPKYKSIRIVLILVIIIAAGWFIMNNMNLSKSNQGSVINQTPTKENITDKEVVSCTKSSDCTSYGNNCYCGNFGPGGAQPGESGVCYCKAKDGDNKPVYQ
ncbi:MAG: hypothetical protein WCG45_03020 [bacterium]